MKFKMEPLPHQRVEFERTKKRKNFARWWEMGLGKTKTSLDEAAFLHSEGHIEAMLVLAPNGVHTAWALDEVPKHCAVPCDTFLWESKKANNKSFDVKWHRFMMDDKGMKIFCVNHEAIMTKKCWNLIKKFLGRFKTFLVVDEGHCFKTPGAKRTMRLLSFAKHADARRVLTGTPITNSPFDVYSQMRILNKDFWKDYGLDDYTIFKGHFGIMVKQYIKDRKYIQCVGYQNLEELKEIVGEHSSRLLKDDVLDLPPKMYSRRYFDMTADQIRVYTELEKEFMTYLDGELVTADLAIVRMQRLQQITSGYLPTDEGDEPVKLINEENVRIKCLAGLIEEIPHKAIIWCKYKLDVEFVMEALEAAKMKAVHYYGDTKTQDRLKNKEAFINGDAQFFVATEACAGTGLNLTVAKTVVYYNTTFKLHHRLQSEDRAHRVGQDRSVNYYDLIAQGTIDSKIINRLVEKKDIANAITGDEIKKWL